MKQLLSIAFIIVGFLSGNAQQQSRTCGTMEHHEYLKLTRKNYEQSLLEYNQMINNYITIQQNKPKNNVQATVTIPVVVHIVYNTTAENLTDAQIQSQIQVLNEDFAKTNADRIKVTQPTFSTVAAGSSIQFCLAQRDPSGNATTGIVRKQTTVTAFSTNDAVKFSAQGGDNAWDVSKYMNIWICDLGSTLLGYGEFPTGSLSNTWGLVLNYRYTGRNGTAQQPFNLGRTGTHEVGHCFNLIHIWGDENACNGDDQCADTPNQAASSAGCFTAGSIQTDGCATTSPGKMWMNYMDYTDDACMYMFTQNQVTRMEAIINNPPWNVLKTSNGCTPVTSLDASISAIINPSNNTSICNSNITPIVRLLNAGSSTLTTSVIYYKMDATATQSLNWSGSLTTGNSTTITLNSYTGLTTGAHTFSAWVGLPNGGTDQNSANNSSVSNFTVTNPPVGQALPFTERFETTTFPPTGWVKTTVNQLNVANTWTRVANATGIPVTPATSACARMDNFSGNTNITGQRDILRSPALDFSSANNTLKLKFDVSHRRYSSAIDSLNVWISSDCGSSWTRIYNKGGASLATVTGTQSTAFTPTANAQWRRDSVSLSSYAGLNGIYLRFESVSGYGNNLYLDNINVATTSISTPTASFISPTSVCVNQVVTFTNTSTGNPTSYTWTTTGATAATSTSTNAAFTYTATGVRTVTLIAANGTSSSTTTRTLTVNASPTVAVSSASICSGTSTVLTANGANTYSWSNGATTQTISVTPNITTNYTVVGANSLGCSQTRTTAVTVNATPTVAVNTATICTGTSATLTASGATTYSWNTGSANTSIIVTPPSNSNYTVTGTNAAGCSQTKTTSVIVTTSPTVTVNSATICAGTSTILAASGANTYTWSSGAQSTTLSVNPTATTVYTVTGKLNGCNTINIKTVTVTVNATPTIAVTSVSICAGTSTILTASGASTYSWSTGANTSTISITPTSNSNYTVVGTNSFGCSQSKTSTVTINASPNVAVNSATICSGSSATLIATGAATYSWNTGSNNDNVSVSPTSSTAYTVIGTNSLGCSQTKTTSVSVISLPTISVNSATICEGNSATLIASGATSYTWNTGSNNASISVNPLSTTVYTVSGTSNDCPSSVSETVSVTVNQNPNVTLSASNLSLCTNSAQQTLNGTPTGGTYSGTGVSGNTFNPNIAGSGNHIANYNFINSNGCSGSANVTFTVSVCTGITEIDSKHINVYPNPAKDLINIEIGEYDINSNIEIYDAIGKLVYSAKTSGSLMQINIGHFACGVYNLRLSSNSSSYLKRIIKE